MSEPTSPTSGTKSFSMDWSDRYVLGVDVIDQQHRKLFHLIDQLALGIQSGNSEQALQSVFEELSQYTKIHFETETRLMVESAYPNAADHGKRHRDLEDSLAELIGKAKRGEPWVSLETMNFLRQWLYHHIDDIDRQLAEHLRGRAAL